MSQPKQSQVLFRQPNECVIPATVSMCLCFGRSEAMILQQVHFWAEVSKNRNQNFHAGRFWVYNTYEDWRLQGGLGLLGKTQLKRLFGQLEKDGFLLAERFRNGKLHYALDYEALNRAYKDCRTFKLDCGAALPSVESVIKALHDVPKRHLSSAKMAFRKPQKVSKWHLFPA